ncbi:hypothetical protein BH10ACI1_BH10ACI1_16240 [soil metagenome]
MLEVKLTYSINESLEEIALDGGKISLGRGSEADLTIDDDGLSRLHAVIYREDDQIWIVDENSTNGTFVNGERVSPSGTALFDGDIIKIGNYTKLKVTISEVPEKEEEKEEEKAAAVSAGGAPVNVDTNTEAAKSLFGMIPLLITGLAIFVIAVSAIVIGANVFGSNSEVVTQSNDEIEQIDTENGDETDQPKIEKTPSGSSTTSNNGGSATPTPTATPLPKLPENPNTDKVLVTETKKYQQLSDTEKKSYISIKAEQIAQIIGNQKSEPIPPSAIDTIKRYVDGYMSRLNKAKNDNCSQGSWTGSDFRSVLERATKTSPFVVHNFEKENLAPQIGIYVAMIESEHCSCLTSPTGAVGMFQFLPRSAPDYGLAADQRCDPELSAKAAAAYLKSLIGFSGSGPESVPLAIASYNSGQGALRINLSEVLSEKGSQNRSFWTMVENKDAMSSKYSGQFEKENSQYVPKFFATAIIGENPQDFGVEQKPLSLYR